jgi:hypothetical protein
MELIPSQCVCVRGWGLGTRGTGVELGVRVGSRSQRTQRLGIRVG